MASAFGGSMAAVFTAFPLPGMTFAPSGSHPAISSAFATLFAFATTTALLSSTVTATTSTTNTAIETILGLVQGSLVHRVMLRGCSTSLADVAFTFAPSATATSTPTSTTIVRSNVNTPGPAFKWHTVDSAAHHDALATVQCAELPNLAHPSIFSDLCNHIDCTALRPKPCGHLLQAVETSVIKCEPTLVLLKDLATRLVQQRPARLLVA
mmetsp:Transcript_130410/g.260170  ORF Transcript_130410/g.260170 Transcript_130410/m.260170 type:complete len:210 (-) Transcript_130410:429-1058(-)